MVKTQGNCGALQMDLSLQGEWTRKTANEVQCKQLRQKKNLNFTYMLLEVIDWSGKRLGGHGGQLNENANYVLSSSEKGQLHIKYD